MDWARSAWKVLHIKVGLSPFFIWICILFALLQLYSNHLVLSLRNIEVESNDGSHLELLDALGPGRRIFKKCALAR